MTQAPKIRRESNKSHEWRAGCPWAPLCFYWQEGAPHTSFVPQYKPQDPFLYNGFSQLELGTELEIRAPRIWQLFVTVLTSV